MCSMEKSSLFNTVSFRLTLWYAVIFGIFWLVGGIIIDVVLRQHLDERINVQMGNTAREFASLFSTQSLENFVPELQHDAQARGVDRTFSRVLSPEGKIIVESNMTSWRDVQKTSLSPGGFPDNELVFQTVSIPNHDCEVRFAFLRLKSGELIQVGRTLQDNEELMADFRSVLSLSFLVMVFCGIAAGWVLTKRAMSGVGRVARIAVEISRGNLDLRVPPGREGREIEELALSFNKMLDWIKLLLDEMKTITDNIAHDLRSPITRIRITAEAALSDASCPQSGKETAGIIIEECDRLVGMIDTMLEISQAEAGVLQLSKKTIDVKQLVEEAYEIFKPVAEDEDIDLCLNVQDAFSVMGGKTRLQRVVANIVDNALKHTPPQGKVVIATRLFDSKALIEVRDTGKGISEKDLPHIFDRFYRGEKSRSSPGNGLGLSLARSMMRAHGGEISVSTAEGAGSTFSIIFPSIASPQSG